MKKNMITTIALLGVLATSTAVFSPVTAQAKGLTTTEPAVEMTEINEPSVKTAYDWWVYNLGVSPWGISQIKGPLSGGSFNTEGLFSDRTLKVSWKGAPSGTKFRIKAVGQDRGNKDTVTYSDYVTTSSGSVKFTIPYEKRGVIKLYVDSYTDKTMNLTSVHVLSV